MSTPIDPRVDIGHVHLKVADIDRALAFYRDILGFELHAAARRPGGVHLGRRIPPPPRAEHVGVARRLAAAAGHDGALSRRDPLPRPAPLARRARRLVEAKGPINGATDHGVSEAIYLRDPDGNGIELYRDRPGGGVAAAAGREGRRDAQRAARPAGAPRRGRLMAKGYAEGPRGRGGGAQARGARARRVGRRRARAATGRLRLHRGRPESTSRLVGQGRSGRAVRLGRGMGHHGRSR